MNSTLTGALPIPIIPSPALVIQAAALRATVKPCGYCGSPLQLISLCNSVASWD